jgi:(p)ppGpp synthase/HD superfamily hydrolase
MEMSNFELALSVALEAHRGQKDEKGHEHIRHVLRVVSAVPEGDAEIVALLHDVAEKSTISLQRLREFGFAPEIVAAVDAMTRRDGETYESFVKRAAANNLARPVKLADLRDNLRRERAAGGDGGKYRAALGLLGEAD